MHTWLILFACVLLIGLGGCATPRQDPAASGPVTVQIEFSDGHSDSTRLTPGGSYLLPDRQPFVSTVTALYSDGHQRVFDTAAVAAARRAAAC